MRFQRLFAGLVAGCLLAAGAAAQTFPDRRITLIVPYAPGGQTDGGARLLAEKLTSVLGQPVIVENRTGGGGAVGTKAVVNAPPDGYTLMMNTAATHLLPMLSRSVGYDADTQLKPVVQITAAPMLLVVRADAPWKTLGEMLAAANTKPLNYGSSGIGTTNHLAAELLASLANAKAVHIPYRGGAQVTQAVLAGEVDFVIDPVVSTMPLIKAGRVRPLAATAPSTMPELAGIPVVAQSGYPGYLSRTWSGAYVPAGTPDAVVAKLEAAFRTALEDPKVAARLAEMGSPAEFKATRDFRVFIADETKRYGDLIKKHNIRVEQ